MDPILGVTLFSGSVAEYLFSCVFTCSVVNMVTSKLDVKNKELLERQLIGRNHDIQKAMVAAFEYAVKDIFKDCKAANVRFPVVGYERRAKATYKGLLKNPRKILYGDAETGLNDRRVRELLRAQAGVLDKEKVRETRKQAQVYLDQLVAPYTQDTPENLKMRLHEQLLDKTLFYFREMFKQDERVFRALAVDGMTDLKIDLQEIKQQMANLQKAITPEGYPELGQQIQQLIQLSELWIQAGESDEKLDRLFVELVQHKNEVLSRMVEIQGNILDVHEDVLKVQDDVSEGNRTTHHKLDKIQDAVSKWPQREVIITGEGPRDSNRPEIADRIDALLTEYRRLFAGREAELQGIDQFVQQARSGYLLLTAPAGFGKTALLANWLWGKENVLYHLFSRRYHGGDTPLQAYRNLLFQLYRHFGVDRLLPKEEYELRDALYHTIKDGGSEGAPLIVVIDGLDEAEEEFPPPFPDPLPDHVFVIGSARAEREESPQFLERWLDPARRICLDGLAEDALPQWLIKTGHSPLVGLAGDQDFIRELWETTGGFPLHLKYLVDEMVQKAKTSGHAREMTAQSPKGFDAYVSDQMAVLADEFKKDRSVRDLFALVAVARGPLADKDLWTLTDLKDEIDLHNLPWQITRWFHIQEARENLLYAFTHPQLAEAFKNARLLRKRVAEGEAALIGYCGKWQTHHSAYALRHYPDHLFERGEYQTLFELAREPAFRGFQAKEIPEDVYLPLKPLQVAIQAATKIDNAAQMAEFCLIHARQVGEIMQETPLAALRAGSLSRALELADLYEGETCLKWYLLLIWELKDSGQIAEAQEIWGFLQKKELPRNQRHEMLVVLLVQVVGIIGSEFVCFCNSILWKGDSCNAGDKGKICECLIKENYIDYAIGIAQGIGNYRLRADALSDIASALAEAGRFDTAIDTAKGIEDDDKCARALSDIASALAQAGETERAKDIFETAIQTAKGIENDDKRARALSDIASALAEAGRFDTAIDTAKGIEDDDKCARALRNTASALAQAGETERAKDIFETAIQTAKGIENDWQRTDALSAIASALAQAGETERAKDIFDTAMHMAQGVEVGWPRAGALSHIASALVEAGRFDTAIDTAKRIEYDWQRTNALRNTASALAKAGETERAKEIFEIAIHTAQGIEDDDGRASALKNIASALAEAGQFKVALHAAHRIKVSWERTPALSRIASVLAKTGEAERAEEIFETAIQTVQGIKSVMLRSEALSDIASALAQAGQFETAIHTSQGIEDNLICADALSRIALALAQAGETERAKEIIEPTIHTAQGIKSSGFHANALRSIASALAQAGEAERAEEIFETAIHTAQGTEYDWQRADELRNIALALAQAGETERAEEIFKTAIHNTQGFEDDWQRADELRRIASALAKAGQFEAALRAAQGIRVCLLRSSALSWIASVLAKAGEAEQAEEIFEAAFRAALGIEYDMFCAFALLDIASALAKAGQFEAALRAAQGIEDDQSRALALRDIASALAKAGQFDAAIDMAQGIECGMSRASTLKNIASALAKADQFDAAIDMAQGIEYDWQRTNALRNTASALAKAGETERAKEIFEIAIHTAQGIEDDDGRASALKNIASALAEAGQLETAIQTAQGIEDDKKHAEALSDIASALAQAGQKDQALNIPKMFFIKRNEHLPKIAEAFTEANDKNGFKALLIPCAYYPDATYKICAFMINLYPEQAQDIFDVITSFLLISKMPQWHGAKPMNAVRCQPGSNKKNEFNIRLLTRIARKLEHLANQVIP